MPAITMIHSWILSSISSTPFCADEDSERGASLVEYALLLALLAMICIAAVTALGETTSTSFSEATSMLD